jgi:hypothetical protein
MKELKSWIDANIKSIGLEKYETFIAKLGRRRFLYGLSFMSLTTSKVLVSLSACISSSVNTPL